MAVGSVLGALPAALLFPAIVGTKFFDRSLRLSIDRSAVLLLFQPLGALQRVRVQTLAEGVVSPLGAGLAGLLLLAIGRIWPNQLGLLPALMLGLLLLWLLLAQLLRRQYPLVLAQALQGRSLVGGLLSIQDPATRDVLIKALQWSSAASVLHAIEQLGHSDPQFIVDRADSLLLHPAAEVRHAVLLRLEDASDDAPIELIERLADSDPDGEVRGAALRVLAAHDEERILEIYGSVLAGTPDPGTHGDDRRPAAARQPGGAAARGSRPQRPPAERRSPAAGTGRAGAGGRGRRKSLPAPGHAAERSGSPRAHRGARGLGNGDQQPLAAPCDGSARRSGMPWRRDPGPAGGRGGRVDAGARGTPDPSLGKREGEGDPGCAGAIPPPQAPGRCCWSGYRSGILLCAMPP